MALGREFSVCDRIAMGSNANAETGDATSGKNNRGAVEQNQKKEKKAKPKKTRSIFLKIALIMTPFVLVLVLSVLFISYNITHENTIKSYKNQLRIAASNAVQYAESADMDNLDVLQKLREGGCVLGMKDFGCLLYQKQGTIPRFKIQSTGIIIIS